MGQFINLDEMCKSISPWNVKVSTFDERGFKALEDLFDEQKIGDCRLLPYVERVDGVHRISARRHARSGKLTIFSPDGVLLETKRWFAPCPLYPKGFLQEKIKLWSISGGMRRGEPALAAIRRETAEEMKYVDDGEDVLSEGFEYPEFEPPKLNIHPSSVYPDFTTVETRQFFTLHSPVRRYPVDRRIEEKYSRGTMVIFQEWFSREFYHDLVQSEFQRTLARSPAPA